MGKFKFNINIKEIKQYDDDQIQNRKKKEIKSSNNDYLDTIAALQCQQSTECTNVPNNNCLNNSLNTSFLNSYTLNNSDSNSLIQINYSLNSSDSQSTFYDSKSYINKNDSLLEKEKEKENKFNLVRANFYIKNRLYDIPLNIEYNICNLPPKYKINEIYSAYLYPNDFTTYCITITAFLKKDEIYINSKDEVNNTKNYISLLGLYFCGENIEIKNENKIITMKCEPNEFMCKQCMELNKKLYNINDKYLININGRIAKKNKGTYHCFGHFLSGNQIEDCIVKFTCKSCKILNLLSEYYF